MRGPRSPQKVAIVTLMLSLTTVTKYTADRSSVSLMAFDVLAIRPMSSGGSSSTSLRGATLLAILAAALVLSGTISRLEQLAIWDAEATFRVDGRVRLETSSSKRVFGLITGRTSTQSVAASP